MKWEVLSEQEDGREYILVFETGDELMQTLRDFAEETGLTSGHFTAIGGFSSVTLAYFEHAEKKYREIPVDQQVEALMIAGDVALSPPSGKDVAEKPQIHAHGVVGLPDGTTRGGHVLKAVVRPTLELVLVESPRYLRRQFDEKTGLALLALDEVPAHRRGRRVG